MSEKLGNFFLAHFVWVTFAMKQDVATSPIDVRLLGTNGVVLHAQMPSDAVE